MIKLPTLIEKVFLEGGLLSRIMPNFEYRQEQIEMAQAVQKAIEDSAHLIVEAGTGVGKSFAYLAPLINHIGYSEKPTIISTNTIALQEQILNKDIPILKNALDIDFNAVLVKGRSNYLCLRRLQRIILKKEELISSKSQEAQLNKIIAWSGKTEEGSLSDFGISPDPYIWSLVSSDHDSCPGKKCTQYKNCFFYKARKRIEDADILIVNHSLFFTDLALKRVQRQVLPEYGVLVLDEAHNIEDIATEHLGISISNFGVKFLLDILFNPKSQRGFLLSIGDEKTVKHIEWARRESELFFSEICDWMRSKDKEGEAVRIKFKNFVRDRVTPIFKDIKNSLESMKEALESKEERVDLNYYLRRIEEVSNTIKAFLGQELSGYVYWVEISKRQSPRISLNACPIDVSEILKNELFDLADTVILTSATLTIEKGSFGYFKKRTGLENAIELKLGSPFDYSKQVQLFIPKKMPDPDNLEEYSEAVSERIKRYLPMTDGGTFVLFTSYKLMEMVYKKVANFFKERDITLYRQGESLGRDRMLREFRKNIGSVLFGVDSFWQGIDVQGEALTSVIITRLPFSVPGQPLIEARLEEIKKNGGDPFSEYSLPEAVLRLKQGFGRLIRSRQDRGIVVILDNRIIYRRYGRKFLEALPECEIIIE